MTSRTELTNRSSSASFSCVSWMAVMSRLTETLPASRPSARIGSTEEPSQISRPSRSRTEPDPSHVRPAWSVAMNSFGSPGSAIW